MFKQVKSKLKWVFLISLFFSYLVVPIFLLDFKDALGSDFVSFLTGARILRDGKKDFFYDLYTQYVYQQKVIWPNKENSLLPIINLPFVGFLVIPFSYFPLLTAYKLFVLFLFLINLINILLIRKVFKNLSTKYFWILLPFIFYPSIGSLIAGQITPLILLIFLSSLYFLMRGNEKLAAVLLSFLSAKIQYIILIPYIFFLVRRKAEFIKTVLISGGVWFLINLFLSGKPLIYNYIPFVFSTQRNEFGIRYSDMFTLHSSLARILPPPYNNYVLLFIFNFILYIISLYFFGRISRLISLGKAFAVSVLLTLFFSVHGVNYDYSLVVLPILIIANCLYGGQKQKIEDALSLFVLLMLPIFFVFNSTFIVSIFLLLVTLIIIKGDLNISKTVQT